jgi:subtilisin family serine protease
MPIRLASALGSMDEAEAFVWAADHGADVISCSWGPIDGVWWDPRDPRHRLNVPLPDSTRLAMDYAAIRGRGGLGSVICFAAGNGNESVDLDGYASYRHVIAVAACNDSGRRSVYSDFGRAVFCAFPSSDFEDEDTGHPAPLTPGIWTTDRSGNAGYNPGGEDPRGDEDGDFTAGFGGTSSACPGVAGVVALILGKKKKLDPAAVRDIIRQSCDRIDEAGGNYDPTTKRSPLYGYGRVNAYKAVQLAAKSG